MAKSPNFDHVYVENKNFPSEMEDGKLVGMARGARNANVGAKLTSGFCATKIQLYVASFALFLREISKHNKANVVH